MPHKVDKEDVGKSRPRSQEPTQNHKKARQLRTRINTLEKRLERLHRKLSEVDTRLASPNIYNDSENTDLQNLIRDQVSLREQIDDIESQWLGLHTALEAIQVV